MTKYELKVMLTELFESKEISIEVHGNETFVVIDGNWIKVDYVN